MPKLRIRFATIIICCYLIFLTFLLETGGLKRFINPRLSFLTVLAIAILSAMLIFALREAITTALVTTEDEPAHEDHHHDGAGDCACEHHHSSKTSFSNVILLLPILLSLFFPSATLSYQPDYQSKPVVLTPLPGANPTQYVKISTTAPNTPANQPGSQTGQNIKLTDFQEYTQVTIGNIIFDTLAEPKQKLLHAHVFLKGKVLKSNLIAPDEIVLYRIVITCCAADGIPAGVLIKLPGKMTLTNEQWVGVEGTVTLKPFPSGLKSLEPVANMVTPEKLFAYLTADRAYPVAAPSDEYLYPY